MPVTEVRTAEQSYCRRLPGGGFVSIEILPFRNLLGQRRFRGAIVVEHRSDPARREGHEPPAVAFAEGQSVADVFRGLLPLAQSNTALANAVVSRRRSVAR